MEFGSEVCGLALLGVDSTIRDVVCFRNQGVRCAVHEAPPLKDFSFGSGEARGDKMNVGVIGTVCRDGGEPTGAMSTPRVGKAETRSTQAIPLVPEGVPPPTEPSSPCSV